MPDPAINKQIFPSIVHFGPAGTLHVGYDALPYLSSDPTNTIFNAKRFIGRSLDDPITSEYADAHPYRTVSLRDAAKVGELNATSPVPLRPDIAKYSEIGILINASGHPSIVTPEEIGAHVLRHLLMHTAKHLGHKQVRKSNIAVPAKFNAEQRYKRLPAYLVPRLLTYRLSYRVNRQATGAAFKAAGLRVIRTLDEPSAAAMAYDLHKRKDIHHILVYDFGGGTLDVSILYVAKGSVQV